MSFFKILLASFVALFWLASAQAAPVTYTFSGSVLTDNTANELGAVYALGDSVSGSLTFEDSTPADPSSNPNADTYSNALTSVSITFGGSVVVTADGGEIQVGDDSPFGGDSIVLGSYSNQTPAIFNLGPGNAALSDGGGVLASQLASILFVFSSGDVFSGTQIPNPIDAFAFGNVFAQITYINGDINIGPSSVVQEVVDFSIDTFELAGSSTGVPTPGALLLLGAGLLGVGLRRRTA